MNVRKMKSGERKKTLRPVPALDLNGVSSEHQHDENAENSAKAVSKFHTHSIPLDMEDLSLIHISYRIGGWKTAEGLMKVSSENKKNNNGKPGRNHD